MHKVLVSANWVTDSASLRPQQWAGPQNYLFHVEVRPVTAYRYQVNTNVSFYKKDTFPEVLSIYRDAKTGISFPINPVC